MSADEDHYYSVIYNISMDVDSRFSNAFASLTHNVLDESFTGPFRSWEGDRCSICWVDWHTGDAVTTLQCGHYFHSDCARQSLLDTTICPFCRATPFDAKTCSEIKDARFEAHDMASAGHAPAAAQAAMPFSTTSDVMTDADMAAIEVLEAIEASEAMGASAAPDMHTTDGDEIEDEYESEDEYEYESGDEYEDEDEDGFEEGDDSEDEDEDMCHGDSETIYLEFDSGTRILADCIIAGLRRCAIDDAKTAEEASELDLLANGLEESCEYHSMCHVWSREDNEEGQVYRIAVDEQLYYDPLHDYAIPGSKLQNLVQDAVILIDAIERYQILKRRRIEIVPQSVNDDAGLTEHKIYQWLDQRNDHKLFYSDVLGHALGRLEDAEYPDLEGRTPAQLKRRAENLEVAYYRFKMGVMKRKVDVKAVRDYIGHHGEDVTLTTQLQKDLWLVNFMIELIADVELPLGGL